MKNYCIVKNEKFEVVAYEKEERPTNFVIEQPKRNSGYGFDYIISNNDVKIRWTNGTYQGHYIRFSYKGIVLKETNCFNLQSVADYLNKFKDMSSDKLDDMLVNAQKAMKTELEKEIELLQIKKNDLEAKVSKLKKIIQKKEELKELIIGLE